VGRAARLLLQEVEINGGGFVTVLAPQRPWEASPPRCHAPKSRWRSHRRTRSC